MENRRFNKPAFAMAVIAVIAIPVVLFNNCSGGGSGDSASAYSGPHLYVADGSPSSGKILRYDLPLTESSIPSFTLKNSFTNNAASIAIDSSGDLALATIGSNTISFFKAPLNDGNSVSDYLDILNTGIVTQMTFDGAGNLYTGDYSSAVEIFPTPFTNNMVKGSYLNDPGGYQPTGVAIDAGGNVYTTANSGASSEVKSYVPPYSALPNVAQIASVNYGPIAINSDYVFVTYPASPGRIDVYALPINNNAPAFSITNGINYPTGIAIDASGNLYVSNENSNNLTVYAPPFSAASAPTVTLATGALDQKGIAIGP